VLKHPYEVSKNAERWARRMKAIGMGEEWATVFISSAISENENEIEKAIRR